MAIRSKNQQNPPLPKRKRVDEQGNSKKRVFAKSGNATLLLASGMTDNAITVFVQKLQDNAKLLGGKIECNFLIAR